MMLFLSNLVLFNLILFKKVSETMTAFIGGFENRYDIVTFDWSTMIYAKQNSQFIGKIILSSCAILKGIDGETLAVVAGNPSI